MTEKPMQHLLLSLATLPTLGLIFATRSVTGAALTIGRWSEELLRGDRLPVQGDEVISSPLPSPLASSLKDGSA
jgi:hypothetical protein